MDGWKDDPDRQMNDFYWLHTCKHFSPTKGSSLQPDVNTGVDGVASFIRSPVWLVIVLILAHPSPATKTHPHLNTPCFTKTVAI